jgi:hypothetical protein
VPELGVEVDEIREKQAAIHGPHALLDEVHAFGVVRRVFRFGHPSTGEQIVDLSNCHHGMSGRLHPVEQCLAKRRQRVVAPVLGPGEPPRCADKRASDDTADAEALSDQAKGDLARAVQLVDRHDVLVGGNLKHAVGRRIHNERTRTHVLGAKLVDDRRP